MQIDTRQRYKRIFLNHLDSKSAHDEVKRTRLYEALRNRLLELAKTTPSIDIESEIAALSTEYNILCADPDNYFDPATPASDNQHQADAASSQDGSGGVMPVVGQSAIAAAPSKVNRATAAALVLASAALLVALESQACGWIIKRCSDSGWVAVDNKKTYTMIVPHGLGTVPGLVDISFSPEPSRSKVHKIQFGWSTSETGNPVSVSVTSENVELQIYDGVKFRRFFDSDRGAWAEFSEGEIRVRAFR